MKRSNCTKCHYPVTTCVCEYVTKKVKNRTKIVILQHPDEVNLAKNTVRLLQLQLSDIQVVIGESENEDASAGCCWICVDAIADIQKEAH